MIEHRLDELCEILDSKRVPLSAMQRAKRQGPYPYYGAQSIIDYVDDYLLDGKYLLVAEDGANLVTRTQDIANIVSGKIWVNNHAHILGYNGKCPLELLGFILNHSNISPYVTGCAQPKLNQDNLRRIPINLPEKVDAVSSILSSLDDKIAVNRRICENLEAQAQALFKHWFIDFAPFKNGKFVESELGMIPGGWSVGTLSEIADINPSRTIKKGTISTYLDMKNMPTSGSFPINWENKEFVGGMKFKNGDTLMARITPCLENGKVAYVNFLRDGEIAFGSTEYIVMTAKESIFPEFLYTLCRFPSFVNYAVKNMNGSSGRQRVSGETISNYRMVIAPESVYSSVRPLFQEYMLRIRECGFENLRLSTLRDALLPKLMSGQIKV